MSKFVDVVDGLMESGLFVKHPHTLYEANALSLGCYKKHDNMLDGLHSNRKNDIVLINKFTKSINIVIDDKDVMVYTFPSEKGKEPFSLKY